MIHGCYCDLIKSDGYVTKYGEQFDYLRSGLGNRMHVTHRKFGKGEGVKYAKNLEEQIWFNQRWNLNSSRHP